MTDEQSGDPTNRPPAEDKMSFETITPAADAMSREQADVNKLTAEEQMARFEKELKEEDWGHQPC